MRFTMYKLLPITMMVIGIATVVQSQFSPIANFDGTNGGNPRYMTLAQGLDGNFYGTTYSGGANGVGVMFQLKAGTITALHTFSGVAPDGSYPVAGLVLATNSKFYGTTELGGGGGGGTIFSMTPLGIFTTLHQFNGTDGVDPEGALIESASGGLYGTAQAGGSGSGGTVFKMTPAGVLSTVYSFTGLGGDGEFPFSSLVQGSDGKFYGTTYAGGGNLCNCGTVYRVTPAGAIKILHSFGAGGSFLDGSQPIGGLVQGLDGNFYGTTPGGGGQSGGSGTVFQITPAGVLTTLHAFAGYPGDGALPYAGLTLGSDGNLYGTTYQGGSQSPACNCGTLYQIATDGTYRMMYSFTNGTDGRNPYGGLLQATDGSFYGTTFAGGSNLSPHCQYSGDQTCGVIFRLSVGLPRFVTNLPKAAKVATAVKILGTGLSGATSVSFNGTPAAFVVVSSHQITTSVPAGAASGYVTVTTPSGTFTSNVPFQVLP